MARIPHQTPTGSFRCKTCKSAHTFNRGGVCTKCLDKEEKKKSPRGKKRPLY